ncbi:MAG: DUF296 domain-containing protein, partial [Haliea sp.]
FRAARGSGAEGVDGDHAVGGACVLSAVGSLSAAVLRYADQPTGTTLAGPLELLTLSGTLSLDGPHLHATVADAQGQVRGGHLMRGCTVRTTAELVLGLLPGWQFSRAPDPATGFMELVMRRTDVS